jgi:hypothetical protein
MYKYYELKQSDKGGKLKLIGNYSKKPINVVGFSLAKELDDWYSNHQEIFFASEKELLKCVDFISEKYIDGTIESAKKYSSYLNDGIEIYCVEVKSFRNTVDGIEHSDNGFAYFKPPVYKTETTELSDVKNNWREQLKKIEDCPQRQDCLRDQLNDLRVIANKFGFYDAADYLKPTESKNYTCSDKKAKQIHVIRYKEGRNEGKIWGTSFEKETLIKAIASENRYNEYFKNYTDEEIWNTIEKSGEFEIITTNHYIS